MARRHTTHLPLELSWLFDLYATGQLAITRSDSAVERYGIADGFAALSLIRALVEPVEGGREAQPSLT